MHRSTCLFSAVGSASHTHVSCVIRTIRPQVGYIVQPNVGEFYVYFHFFSLKTLLPFEEHISRSWLE